MEKLRYTIKKSLFLIRVSSKTHDAVVVIQCCASLSIFPVFINISWLWRLNDAPQVNQFWHSLSLFEVLKVKMCLLGDESLCRFIVSCEKSKETLCSAALQQVNGRLALWGRTFNSAPVSHQQLVWSLLLLRAWRIKPHCLFLFWTNAFLITV